jgi:transcriptional regulator with XRE-family HTH domain
MKLPEKILYCRKQASLSQEALADRLGVSRQAVSKWETGDAVPEVGKLPLLAQVFGVSADWLLSEDGPEKAPPAAEAAENREKIIDLLPRAARNLVRRHGWLAGVCIALRGALLAGAGLLIRWMIRRILFVTPFAQDPDITALTAKSPPYILGRIMVIAGLILVVLGVVLAVWLRRKGIGKKA